jgi:urease accessory protein
MTKTTRRFALAAALLALAGAASAHTGHATHGFFAGLEHPFGLDHLLAMVAVGLWSAAALRGAGRAFGPLAFLAAMSAGAAFGAAGFGLPFVETGIAASVLLMGVLLVFARRVPPALGLVAIAISASLHGLAHGGEMPAGAGFASYATGFLLTTALLHAGGLALGARFVQARDGLWRVAGVSLAGVGLALLTHV